jgi:hypothetical protein
MSTDTLSLDLATVKTYRQGARSSGDYAVIGTTLQIIGGTLCDAMGLPAWQNASDVAAGNGNATLAAVRRWCDGASTDHVLALSDRGCTRASATPGRESSCPLGHDERLATPFPGCTVTAPQRVFTLRYRSPRRWLQVFGTWYGPDLKAFAAVGTSRHAGLDGHLLALIHRMNRSGDRTMVVPSPDLEVIVTKP